MFSASYFFSLAITIILEAAAAFALTRGNRRIALATVGINYITHPLFHLVVFGLLGGYYSIAKVYVGEVSIIAIEYVFLRYIFSSMHARKLLYISLGMNIVSYSIGSVAFRLAIP